MKKTTSSTRPGRFSSSTIEEKESSIRSAFSDRECRLIEAESIIALISEVVAPPEDYTTDKPFDREWLGLNARYGLLYMIDKITDVLKEYHDSMCKCYEREQEGSK